MATLVYDSRLQEDSWDITSGIEDLAYQNESINKRFNDTTDRIDYEINKLKGQLYDSLNEQKELKDQLNKKVMLVHNCSNCGATLNIEENKPIFHCRYCGSTYIIGATQLYSNY